MEDGWDSHVSPLMMGVGIGEMQGMGDMQGHGQDISGDSIMQHHHEMSAHNDLSQDLHQDIDQDMSHHDMRSHHGDNMGGSSRDYYSQQDDGGYSFQNKEAPKGKPILVHTDQLAPFAGDHDEGEQMQRLQDEEDSIFEDFTEAYMEEI